MKAFRSEIEVWKPIPNCEGYEVSSFGNVRSVDRVVSMTSCNGKRFERNFSGKLIKPQFDGKGNYLHVSLGRRKVANVHRLVAEAFLPNPNNFSEVNHKDENKLNNHVSNLEWCDHLYNSNYGSRRDSFKGENNPMNQYKEEVVREIKESYIPNDKEFGVAGLAEKYGMSQTHVCAIVKGRRWGWVKSR